MRNIRRKVEEYQFYAGEQPTISQKINGVRLVRINDRWIEKIEIDQALQYLLPRHRAILTMLYIKGKTIRRTAFILGISKSTVFREAAKAIEELERLLKTK